MNNNTVPPNDFIYSERISSNRTEAPFLVHMVAFFMVLIWCINTHSPDWLAFLFTCCSTLFLFYSTNFRILLIHLTPTALKLTFGIFSWTIALENNQSIDLDKLPGYREYAHSVY